MAKVIKSISHVKKVVDAQKAALLENSTMSSAIAGSDVSVSTGQASSGSGSVSSSGSGSSLSSSSTKKDGFCGVYDGGCASQNDCGCALLDGACKLPDTP
ncbi:MAG: hypothetical protein GY765_19245 [bacterium]|nr:hypothetical protein [bacterium]